MKKYFLRQLLLLLPVLLGVTLVTFLLLQLVAGDTVDLLQQSHGAVSASVKQQLRSQLGLDQPLPVQYVTWLLHLLTGDAGYSYISGQSVSSLLLSKLPSTIILTISALLLALLLAIPAGIISALQQNKFWDYLLQLLSFLGSSVPGFAPASPPHRAPISSMELPASRTVVTPERRRVPACSTALARRVFLSSLR